MSSAKIYHQREVAMNKKAISLSLTSLLVLTIFVGLVSTAGVGGQQMPSHSTSLAEGSGLSRASDDSALLSELGQNGSYKSTGIATNITFVNCPFFVWPRFYAPHYANQPAQFYRRNLIASQWEYINQSKDTNADGYVAFQGVKESKPGIYDYVVTFRGSTPIL